MQDRFIPRYWLPLSRPEWKKVFFMQMLPPHINQNGSTYRLNWVVSHIKHQQTRNTAQFWATEVFELSYLSSKLFCNKTGGLAINLYRKLNTYAKDLNFSRICSRLVDVRDVDSVKSQAENDFSDICCKLFSLFFCIIFSSPEPKARVSYCHSAPSVVRPSVRPSSVVRPSVNFSHFRLLLQNRWMNFDETW